MRKPDIQFVFLYPETDGAFGAFLEKNQLAGSKALPASFQSLGIQRTPAIFALDPSGRIRQEWVGKLDERGEAEVHALFQ